MIGTPFSDTPSKNSSFDALGRLPLGHPKASSLQGLVQPRLIRPANQVEGTAVLIQRNAVLAAKALQPLVELFKACGLQFRRARRALQTDSYSSSHLLHAVQHCITGRRLNKRGSKGRDHLAKHFRQLA